MHKLDAYKLIKEVEKRPALWNMTTKEYNDREMRKECWQEICALFTKENMTTAERQELESILQKKWKNIRDNFSKDVHGKRKSEGGCMKATYKYSRQLQFLRNTIERRAKSNSLQGSLRVRLNLEDVNSSVMTISPQKVTSSCTTTIPQKTSPSHMTISTQKSPSQKMGEISHSVKGRTTLDWVGHNEPPSAEDDDNRQFLLSLLPTLASLPKRLNSRCRLEFMTALNKYEEFAFMQKQEQESSSNMDAVYIESHYEPEQSQLPSPVPSIDSYVSNFSEESKCII